MTIPEILNGTRKEIKANMNLLAEDYLEKTGRKVCRSCPSDIQFMLLSLKNIYKMCQFKFKRHAAHYKNKKGDKVTIHNGNLTDEKAIEFLRTNPERIALFSVFPSNWETLIIDGVKAEETEAEKEARLAAEAEAAAAAGAGSDLAETEAEKEARLAAEAAASGAPGTEQTGQEEKPSREDLMKMQLKDLRAKYPNVSANSIKGFVDKVLAE